MARISLISVCMIIATALAFTAANAYYPIQPGFGGNGMAPGVCPPSGCPTMAMPMGGPAYQPAMPAKITKCKPQPAPYCGAVPCAPPTCAPVCMPICKPPVRWY